MKKHDNYQHILDTARSLIQTKGYNAFSYRDIAQRVGVKTSSIHYYFPTKADLGKAAIQAYAELLEKELTPLQNNSALSCYRKLELFFQMIFENTYLIDQQMCLGGILAADVSTLPSMVQAELKGLFNQLENWLSELLKDALKKGQLVVEGKKVKEQARIIISLLEGSLLLTRLFQDESRFWYAQEYALRQIRKG